MSSPGVFGSPVQKVSDLLFFDNLALYYLLENTPTPVLARVFQNGNSRLAGAMLGILGPEQRKEMHGLMAQANDGDALRNQQAEEALLIIAADLLARGFVRKQGPHYFGTPREEKLQAGGE